MDGVKKTLPQYFKDKKFVLEVGSQDINGTNNYLFEDCSYIGLDLGPGKNVDVVCHVADFRPDRHYETIISTNAFEHDERYLDSINAIVTRLLAPGGLFAFSCASIGTPEHGTHDHWSGHSPYTNDHYKNLTEEDIREALVFEDYFSEFKFRRHGADLRFYGLKKVHL